MSSNHRNNHENNGYHTFLQESPEVAQAFGGLIQALGENGGLDNKTRQLIYIGIRATQGEAGAVAAHAPMAKQAGATRQEIQGAILMTLTTCGITGITNCLVPALTAFDQA